ncbi:MAG: patatin family protein [Treponema sp.]|nr:patatin family protein [Treponema sp.]
MKTGLVLEGGAMRGIFTCGVIDAWMENGIVFDGGIGVSAGACFGCNYKSKQIGRAIRYNKAYCNDKRYASIRNLIFTKNLYSKEFCYHTMPLELDPVDLEAYKNNPMEFWAVASDIETGKPVYRNIEKIDDLELEFVRASASMPLVSTPVDFEGKKLLDGGMTDSIPLKFFQSIGYEKNVVVLTQPKEYKKEPNKLMPLVKMGLKKYPAIVEAMRIRHEMYNAQKQYAFEQEELGNTLVIYPEKDLGIGKTCKDPAELDRVYQIGRHTGNSCVEQIRNFLK